MLYSIGAVSRFRTRCLGLSQGETDRHRSVRRRRVFPWCTSEQHSRGVAARPRIRIDAVAQARIGRAAAEPAPTGPGCLNPRSKVQGPDAEPEPQDHNRTESAAIRRLENAR
jgi:hypothetical protein